MRKWPFRVTVKLLELYEQRPCLWDHRLPSYKIRKHRDKALQEIIEVMSQYVRGINVRVVREKIRSIRKTYFTEYHKVEQSRQEAESENDIYIPLLPWYQVADRFLRHTVETEDTKNFTESQGSDLQNITEPDDAEGVVSYLMEDALVDNVDESPADPVMSQSYDNPSSIDRKLKSLVEQVEPVKRQRVYEMTNVMTNGVNMLNKTASTLQENGGKANSPESQSDDLEVFGKLVAAHLRKLPETTALDCQTNIMKYLVEQRWFVFSGGAQSPS